MKGITLSGHTPVMYFDCQDEALDGRGWNVLWADGSWADRVTRFNDAVEALRQMVEEG